MNHTKLKNDQHIQAGAIIDCSGALLLLFILTFYRRKLSLKYPIFEYMPDHNEPMLHSV